MKSENENEIIDVLYELLLSKKYYTRNYIKFLMWKKIIYFHYPNLISTDYYLRKIFDTMVERELFLCKRDKNRVVYKLNDFRIEDDEIDLGYMHFD